MKEAKFTKGPWRVDIEDCFEHPYVQRSKEGGFSVLGLSEEKEIADAHLITAAPELFEALRCLLEKADLEFTDGRWPETRNDARAALAKALGEHHAQK